MVQPNGVLAKSGIRPSWVLLGEARVSNGSLLLERKAGGDGEWRRVGQSKVERGERKERKGKRREGKERKGRKKNKGF